MTATAVWPIGLPHREASLIYHAMPFTVYRQYDSDGVLLYVGCTDNLDRRTAEHRRNSPWWSQVGRIESELLPNHAAARAEEWRLIKTADPLYNIAGASDPIGVQVRRAELRKREAA